MINKSLNIFEYSKEKITSRSDSDSFRLTSGEIEKLEKLSEKIMIRDRLAFAPISFNYRAEKAYEICSTCYVGLLKVNNKIIQILPKMARGVEDKEYNKEAIRNLLYMLSYTKKLSVSETSIANLTKSSDDFFEILINLFATNLLKVIKNDLNKQYINREENLNFIKGKLQLRSHLKLNLVNQHRFYLEYDEFCEDNLLNRILKRTTTILLKSTSNFANLRLLQELDSIFAEITPQEIVIDDFKKVVLTRLNKEYEPILNLCKVFITNSSLTLSYKNLGTFSFIFNMNTLFEEFIGEFIKKEISLPNDTVSLQGPIRHLVNFKTSNEVIIGQNIFQLKPDIQITPTSSNIPRLIIDTKYKILDDYEQRREGVSQADLYQMLAYAKKYSCNDITLLYPKRSEQNERNCVLTIDEVNISINTIDLCLDIKSNKDRIRQSLRSILLPITSAITSSTKSYPISTPPIKKSSY